LNSHRQHLTDTLRLVSKMRMPLLVAFLLRLVLMLAAFALTGTHVMTQGDSTSYLEPGRSLILHGAFSSTGMPEIDRTPGYPIFAGLTGMIFNNVLLTVFAQIVVSLLSLLIIGRIADRIFPDRKAGIVAAWLYAFEPLSIVYTSRLMPETLFVLLLLVVIDRALAFLQSKNLTALAAAGIILATATFVRPVSYYLALPLALGLAAITPPMPSLRWKAPLVLLLATLPWLAAWQMRNFIEAGYAGFSSIVEKNLYFFQSAEVTAELQHISLAAEQKQLGYPDEAYYLAAHPDQVTWSRAQRLSYMHVQATKILRDHPGLYLKTHFAGIGVVAFTPSATELLQLLNAYPPTETMPHRILNEGIIASFWRVFLAHPAVAFIMALIELCLLILYAFAIRGFFATMRNSMTLMLAGIALYFLLISGGAQAVGRYRLPIMPELCILAAGGWTLVLKKKRGASMAPRFRVTARVRS
jgi:hypothetical protein